MTIVNTGLCVLHTNKSKTDLSLLVVFSSLSSELNISFQARHFEFNFTFGIYQFLVAENVLTTISEKNATRPLVLNGHISGTDPGSPEGGTNPKGEGSANLLSGQIFPKTT